MRPVRTAPLSSGGFSEVPTADIHFGLLLKRARERRGMTIQDVSRVTRISDKWLPALEEGRLDLLPAPVFVTGYVRSYARLVGLDGDELVDQYQTLAQHRPFAYAPPRLPPSPAAVEEPSAPSTATPPRKRSALLVVCSVLLLLVALGALLWYLRVF